MQKILIVDDSEINREILAAMLEKTYEIDMAKDVESEVVGVHNGIIENYTELKEKGHPHFKSSFFQSILKLHSSLPPILKIKPNKCS
mgnify:CR=1 FL=1